jgi:leucyl aminopeptidase
VLNLGDQPVVLDVGDPTPGVTMALPIAAGAESDALRRAGFAGDVGERAVVLQSDAATHVAFGIGRHLSADSLRTGAMALGQRLTDPVGLDLTDHPESAHPELAAAFVEGAVLGSYRWSPAAGAEPPGPELFIRVSPTACRETAAACTRVAIRARAANWARRLTDTPPAQLRPADLARLARALAATYGWTVATLSGDDLANAGLGALDAVGRGSPRAAQLIDLRYTGRGEGDPDVVLIGKGITMDCGGWNLKTERPITAVMKSDMAGGAAVLATLAAATTLELPVNIRVLVPAAENLPGPDAILPGDVIEHFGGRTTEVTMTDAEGRLVLADCLAYARHQSPEAVLIDVGTLSEAPFAPSGWTMVCGHDRLAEGLRRGAQEAGERAVAVPRVDWHDDWIASPVADSKNYSFAHAPQDLLVVAAFLAPFAGEGPWAHIDTCAVAYLYEPWSTWPQGATGSPTRPLVELLSRWAEIDVP